jgi:anti-sigma factor RsiW
LTCRGLIARLADLSSGDLAPRQMRESKRHLAGCRSCAAYRRSYRATVDLARQAYRAPGGAEGAEMPEALIGGILTAARTRLSVFSPRAWRLVHLLSGIAAGPLLAFCLR